ncbi:hypothetical protein VM1G_06161 [Cytospora mali]|uniref:Uncharacterized protein n=1 Tax=Cytospora mali TaxID=578113 RepID=A0A194W3Y1_CYTMA|nr:hypothetical protein VM1G_06161 [Valsa mali]
MLTDSTKVIAGNAEGLTRQQAAICGTTSRQNIASSENTVQKDQTAYHGGTLRLETARSKMGNLITKLVTGLGPNQLSDNGNTAAAVEFLRDLRHSTMAPGSDEMPSPAGSTTSLDSVTGGDRPHSSLFWPYTSEHRIDESCSDGSYAPLRIRRPALYDEYWAKEERYVPGATADEGTVEDNG